MNVPAEYKKIFGKVERLQIAEEDLTIENFSEASFRAGQLDMAKLLMNLSNGDLSDEEYNFELAKLEPSESVN